MRVAQPSRLPLAIPIAIALAWILAMAAQFSGSATFLHHDALIERGPPLALAVALSIAAWLVMIGAMMLPSSIPLIGMFAAASSRAPRAALMLALFLAGYVVVWTAFGLLAFFGDVLVHRTVDRVAWLGAHPWIIAAGVLALAGAFQFTPLKDQCLRACRRTS